MIVQLSFPHHVGEKVQCSTIELMGPSNDSSIIQYIEKNACYEPGIQEWISKILRPGHHCIDVGANFGQHSILMSKLVGPQGRVFCFEASPKTFAYLEQNLERNHCQNVQTFSVGIWDEAVEMDFSYVEHVAGCSFFSTTGCREGKTEKVSCRSLDSFFPEGATRIALIKIDIEGAEIKAIEGAKNLIRRDHPALLTELNRVTLERFYGASVRSFCDQIDSIGYEMRIIDESGNIYLVSNREELESLLQSKFQLLNVLCLPCHSSNR